MANIEEHLKPTLATATTLYTASWLETISTLSVANTSATSDTFSIYVIPSWESLSDTYAQPKTASISWNDLITFTLWMTPKAGTIIQVLSTAWYCNFHLYGKTI